MTEAPRFAADIGAVAIARNEGERLKSCLRSLIGKCAAVVYVDSGSSDGSVAFARSLGVEVVELDLSKPFSMARARNAGFAGLRFHDLRHTAATLMLEAGVHPKVVSERLGHSTIAITLDTYSHVMPHMQAAAAETLDAALRLT